MDKYYNYELWEKEWLINRIQKLEKEVVDLESRNEMLVNNLLEVEKMYNKLKEEK